MDTKWQKAQELEKTWWGNCKNTFGEETKQLVYADKMGLLVYDDGNSCFTLDAKGKKILDIGCGPVSMLLKCVNLSLGVAIDPCEYPNWVAERYRDAGIHYGKHQGEDIPEDIGGQFDEVWIYNCLQHTENPQKIVDNAKRVGKVIRLFEWIEHPINDMHPQLLTAENLDAWLGGKGTVEDLNQLGCVGKCYYGVFNQNITD